MDENSVIINSAFGVNIIGKTLTEILLITYTGVGVRVIDQDGRLLTAIDDKEHDIELVLTEE